MEKELQELSLFLPAKIASTGHYFPQDANQGYEQQKGTELFMAKPMLAHNQMNTNQLRINLCHKTNKRKSSKALKNLPIRSNISHKPTVFRGGHLSDLQNGLIQSLAYWVQYTNSTLPVELGSGATLELKSSLRSLSGKKK